LKNCLPTTPLSEIEVVFKAVRRTRTA